MSGVLTVDEAARRLGIGRRLAYRCCAEGTLPAIRLGRRWVIPAAAVERLLAEGPAR